jgi:hypothetical protein
MTFEDVLMWLKTGAISDGRPPPPNSEFARVLTDEELAALREALGLDPNAPG